jgi:ABC-type spermidine/putrescine transport system permease subunit II
MLRSAAPEFGTAAPRFERWRNKFLSRLTSAQFLIAVGLLIVLAYLVIYPLFELIWRTLVWGAGDRRFNRSAVEGEFTSHHWYEIFFGESSSSMLFDPLWNTMVTGSAAAILALLMGGLLAWVVVRTDMPGKRWLQPVLTLPYVIPSFAIALRVHAAGVAVIRRRADHHHHGHSLFPLCASAGRGRLEHLGFTTGGMR